MAPNPKPTIFIAHGAWHVPESYKKLTLALESQGYEVHVPRFPSTNGTRPPNADMYADTLLVRSYVESLVRAGRTVVAILHSYGGIVGSNALYGLGVEARAKQSLGGGISQLIYMAGYMLPEGMSVMDKNREIGGMHDASNVLDLAEDGSCIWLHPKGLMIGPWPDEAEADEYASTLVRWNLKCLDQPVEHAAWRDDIPLSYIFTTKDLTLPPVYQKNMQEAVQKSGRKVRIFEVETGHCPHLTATGRVVEIVNEIVSA